MTKNLKAKGEEKRRLSDWINGTLNNITRDAVDFNIRHVFNIDLTFLRTRDLRRLKKEIEKLFK